MKKLLFILSLFFSFAASANRVEYGTIFTTEIYRPNLSGIIASGDTLVIVSTNLSGGIEFYNTGNFVVVAKTNFYATFYRLKGYAHHITLYSTGSGSDTTSTRSISLGVCALSNADHNTVIGVRISGGSIGIYCKTDPDYSDPTSWGYPNTYRMTGNSFIGCWIKDVDGEGMYIGHTSPYGKVVSKPGGDTTIIPIVTDSTTVAYCVVSRTGWDGIQLSNCRNGNTIHHNKIDNTGLKNEPSQMAGIIVGGNMNCTVYDNYTFNTHGNACEIFGYGNIPVYNNSFVNSLEANLFSNSYPTTDESDPLQAIDLNGNYFSGIPTEGAVRMYNDFRNHHGHNVRNNRFCKDGVSDPMDLFTVYTTTPNTIFSNNTMNCTVAPKRCLCRFL